MRRRAGEGPNAALPASHRRRARGPRRNGQGPYSLVGLQYGWPGPVGCGKLSSCAGWARLGAMPGSRVRLGEAGPPPSMRNWKRKKRRNQHVSKIDGWGGGIRTNIGFGGSSDCSPAAHEKGSLLTYSDNRGLGEDVKILWLDVTIISHPRGNAGRPGRYVYEPGHIIGDDEDPAPSAGCQYRGMTAQSLHERQEFALQELPGLTPCK